LRERFDLGPALSARDAVAPLLEPAFNRSEPRDDQIALSPLPYQYVPPTAAQRTADTGDTPGPGLLFSQWRHALHQELPELGEATLRNASRLVGEDVDRLPGTVEEAKKWLADRFLDSGPLPGQPADR
jgi:hypothetical protein